MGRQDGYAEARKQPGRVGRAEPSRLVPGRLQAGDDERVRGGDVDVGELGHDAFRTTTPVGQIRSPRQRQGGRLRKRERGNSAGAVVPAQCVGDPGPPEEARDDRLVAGPGRGVRDRARDVFGTRHERWDEQGEERVYPRIGEHDSQRALVLFGRRRRDEVDRIANGRIARNERAQLFLTRGRQLRDLEACTRARVGRQDARPTRVAQDRDPPPGRQRLVREHLRGVEQLFQRVDADHACLTEERVDGDVGGRERGRVRRRGAATGLCTPALHGDDRLLAATRRASRANLRGFPNDSR